MNPEINMNYRFKYIAVGVIIYIVTTYAWSIYEKNK